MCYKTMPGSPPDRTMKCGRLSKRFKIVSSLYPCKSDFYQVICETVMMPPAIFLLLAVIIYNKANS